MAKKVTANGKTFTFDDNITNEQIGSVIDEYFSDIQKKSEVENAYPSGTQTSKRGFEPFQSQVDTKTPSVLLSEEQRQQKEQDRIAKRFETTLLDVPTEFGRVDQFMRSAKKVKDTLPEVPTMNPSGQMTVIPQGEKIGDSLRKGDTLQDDFTDKLTGKKTGLQKQIENAENAFRAYQGDEIANQAQGYVPPEETLKIKQELGFGEKMSNAGSNFVNKLERFVPNTALALGQTLTTLLGEDYGSDAYRMITASGNADIHRMEAFDKLAKLDAEYKYSKGLIQSVQDLDLGGVAAAVTDAVGSLISTVVTSAPTAGLGLYADMVGSGLYDYNSTKANRLGITVEQLYDSGQNDFFVPAILGGVGAQLEKIGLKGIKQGILSNIKSKAGQKAGLIFHNSNKEGFTEWTQSGLEAYSNSLAQGKNAIQAGEEAVKEMFSKKGAESYLMGAVAAGAAIGGGRILRGIVSSREKKKAADALQKIEQQQQELSNPDISEESRVFIFDNIKNNVKEVVDAVYADVDESENLGENQKKEVFELNKTIQALEIVANDPAVSEETKASAQTRIDELKSKVDDIIATPEIKLAKPTFDTEEQLVEEIRAAEKEFNETGDSAEYQLKINDLNTRLENLVPELEEEQSATDLFKIDGQDKFYHASPKKREGRLREGTAPQFGKGVYFSTNKDLVIDEFGNEVTEVQIKAKKPLFTNSKEESEVKDLAAKKWNEENLTYDSENEMYVDRDGNEVMPVDAGDLGERLPISYYSSAAKELGYDVIVDKDSSSYDNEIVVIDESIITYPEETQTKTKQDAVQVETAGQVPVLTEAPVGEEVEQGKPQPEAKVVAEEGKEEVGGVVEPIGKIVKPKSIRLNSSEEGLAKMEGLKAKDVYPTRQFFKNKPINVGLPDVSSPQFDPFISENKDNTKEEIVDLSEITPTQELVDKSGIGGKLTIGNPKLVRFNDGLFVLDGHHRIATEAVKGNNKIKADVTTIDMTSDEWGEQKINKFLNEQEDATKTREIEQSNITEREGVTEQQQGKQKDRLNQEESVTESQTKTSDSGGVSESREVEEVTAPEITPNKSVKANQKIASQEIAKARKIRETDGEVLFAQFKDKRLYDAVVDDNAGEIPKDTFIDLDNVPPILKGVFKRLEDSGLIEEVDERYYLTDKGKDFNDAVQARLSTRKGVKAGTDMFPTEAGLSEAEVKKSEPKESKGVQKEDVNEKAKTEEVKRPIETPRVAERKGESAKLQTAKEEFAKVAEKIRALKIDTKGKSFDATLGLPVAVWNGAVETVASAVEAGVALADAIKRGLNYIQKNHRGQWNKKAYNDRVIEELGLRGIEVNGQDLIVKPLEDKATITLVNGFYSPLEKGIAETKNDKATGRGWEKILSGVTEKDELVYTGVAEFLKNNADRPISKKELLDYMKDNRIEVVEVVKGQGRRSNNEIDEILNRSKPDGTTPMRYYGSKGKYGYKIVETGEFIEVNAPELIQLMDEIESDKFEESTTKFSQYQLEGEKENYKEVLVTLPEKKSQETYSIEKENLYFYVINDSDGSTIQSYDNRADAQEMVDYLNEDNKGKLESFRGQNFKSSHFDEPNILVHLRMNTRTDAEGNKVLFIEEVQSDWGQKGKKEGFKDVKKENDAIRKIKDEITTKSKKLSELERSLISSAKSEYVGTKDPNDLFKSVSDVAKALEWLPFEKTKQIFQEYKKTEISISVLNDRLSRDGKYGGIYGLDQDNQSNLTSPAPFVTDTNSWVKLGLKTALKEAVAQKADKIAWTTGEQQNDRYDLSKQVQSIEVEKVKEVPNLFFVDINMLNETTTYNLEVENGIVREGEYKGQRLEDVVGKDIAEKILNGGNQTLRGDNLKVGGKGMKGFYGSPSENSIGIIGGVAKSLFKQEPKTVTFNSPKNQEVIDAYNKARSYGNVPDALAEKYEKAKGLNSTQHSIDITPELKESVKLGLPLFKDALSQAKDNLKQAKAKLDALNKTLGISSDPEQKAKALFEYHKALVNYAIEYIKDVANDIAKFAKEVGLEVSEVKDAWIEANGGEKKTVKDFEEKIKPEKEVSGIKKALVSDEIIESVNLDKISDKQMLELGKKLVETGEIKPENITLSIAKGTPRALQPKEVVALIYYKATLDNKRRELLSEYNKKLEQGESIADVALELDKVQTDIDLYDIMSVITANQQSLAFRLRKGLLDKDYNLVTQIEQYKKVNGGVIPAEVEKRFRELDKQLTELKDKLREAEQRAIEAEEKQSIKNIEEDVKRSNATKNRASLTPQEKARKRELAKKYNVFNDVTRIITIVAEKDFREYAGLILKEAKGDFVEFGRELIKTVGNDIKDFLPKLYKELGGKGEANISDLIQKPFVKDGVLVIPPAYIRDAVENGITEIDALAEAVKKEVESDLPNVTIRAVRDAITQYGRTVNQTKDTVQRQINEAKRLGRLYSELEDLQNKKKKEKSGKVYNKMSDKERELKRKIKILERDIPPTAEEVEQTEEQRSNLRKEYLKKYIQEKKDRLRTGNFAPKSKPSPIRKDSEIIALETEANKIRDEYDAAHYDNEQANRSVPKKILDGLKEWGTGVSRALVAGLDFGFFLVQGIISVTSSNPLKTGYAVKQSFLSGLGTDVNPITETRKFFRELGSERIERELLANLKAQPYYPIIKASKLAIQEPNAKLGERDDALQASVINKIWNFIVSPLKFVNPNAYETAVRINPYRAAERAYTGASNAIRVQMFLDFAQELENRGITYEQSPELYKIAANTANNMTFRGRLRKAEPIAAELNMLFFSARKVTASLSLVNPAYWADMAIRNPIVAKQALLKMATFIGVTTGITLALQAFSDDDEEEQNPDMFNPYSSDFMTYRIGNTRLNFYGGLGSNVVLFARFITANYKTTSSSKIKKLGQDSFTPNRKELVETTLFANKLNPMAGVGYAWLNQSIGREIDWESEAVSSVTPLWAQNISELRREHPETMAAFLSYMSFLGQSINTYGTPEFIDRKKDKELFDLIQIKNASFSEKKRADVDVVDINTGKLREITKDEFETFKKEYGDYVKNYLKSNYKELSKMPVEKFQNEITNLKTRATKIAKEKIIGFNSDLIDIEIDNQDYKLNLNQVKERQQLINDFKDKKGSKIIDRQISNGKTEYEASKILEAQAKSDATDKMKKLYKNGEGLQRK